jgi:hypothetical protein
VRSNSKIPPVFNLPQGIVVPASRELIAKKQPVSQPDQIRVLKDLVRHQEKENKTLTEQNAALQEHCEEARIKLQAMWSELSGGARRGLLLRGIKP